MHPHRWAALLLALVVVAPAAEARSARVKVRVVPITSSADQAVHVRISGLHPRSSAEVRLLVRDARGKLWHSSASFRADRQGVVDLDRAAARSGSYAGRWGMGLVASLTTATRSAYPFEWGTAGSRWFRLEVRARGRSVASRTLRRKLPGAVDERPVGLSAVGFAGTYYTRAPAGPRRPGVLLFGGSEGGYPFPPLPRMLAARGYPTLGVAYFGAPGLPPTLANVSLEYFERALLWLRAQPEVDASRIVVIGISRGSEAAQLLGVHYPELVDAVVAGVPSNVAICGFPDCSFPAWLFDGRPVPYTTQFDNPFPTDNPDAAIPDERIRGPLFLVCGGLDSVWISCLYQRAIQTRLAALGHSYPDVFSSYPRAGHAVGRLLPYFPIAPRSNYLNAPDEQAREAVWPKLLSFLARL